MWRWGLRGPSVGRRSRVPHTVPCAVTYVTFGVPWCADTIRVTISARLPCPKPVLGRWVECRIHRPSLRAMLNPCPLRPGSPSVFLCPYALTPGVTGVRAAAGISVSFSGHAVPNIRVAGGGWDGRGRAAYARNRAGFSGVFTGFLPLVGGGRRVWVVGWGPVCPAWFAGPVLFVLRRSVRSDRVVRVVARARVAEEGGGGGGSRSARSAWRAARRSPPAVFGPSCRWRPGRVTARPVHVVGCPTGRLPCSVVPLTGRARCAACRRSHVPAPPAAVRHQRHPSALHRTPSGPSVTRPYSAQRQAASAQAASGSRPAAGRKPPRTTSSSNSGRLRRPAVRRERQSSRGRSLWPAVIRPAVRR